MTRPLPHYTTLAQTWARLAPPTWTTDDLAEWLAGRAEAKVIAARGSLLGLWHARAGVYHPGEARYRGSRGRAVTAQEREQAIARAVQEAPTQRASAELAGASVRTVRRSAAWEIAARERQRQEEERIMTLLASGVTSRADLASALGATEHRVALALGRMRRIGLLPPATVGRPKGTAAPKPAPKVAAPKPDKRTIAAQIAADRRAKEDDIIREAWAAGLRASYDIAERYALQINRVKKAITRLRARGEKPPRKVAPKRARPILPVRPPEATPEMRLLRAIADEPWSTAGELGVTEADIEPLVKVRLVQRGTGGAVALTDDGWLMVGI